LASFAGGYLLVGLGVVAPSSLGIRMICLRLVLGVVLGCGLVFASLEATADDKLFCTGIPISTKDGRVSDLIDCELWELFSSKMLVDKMQACIENNNASELTQEGQISFFLNIDADGQIVGFDSSSTKPEERGLLYDCLYSALGQPLQPSNFGLASAFIQGRVWLKRVRPAGLGVSISFDLIKRKDSIPGEVPARQPEHSLSCKLGETRLVLRFGSEEPVSQAGKVSFLKKYESAVQVAEDCEKKLKEEKENGWIWAEWKKERKKAGECLVALLGHEELIVQAEAAKIIAAERYWKHRSALTLAIEKSMQQKNCDRNGCRYIAPAGTEEGLAVLDMIIAHLRMRRWVSDEILDAMARHPASKVRLGLVRRILGRIRNKLPKVIDVLIQDQDPVVRAKACQIGCLREHKNSQIAFLAGLEDPKPENRVATVLHATGCAKRSRQRVIAAIEKEKNPLVAVLMLQSIPYKTDSFLIQTASQALSNPCPIVRFMAAKLLGRIEEKPEVLIRTAIENESDPILKKQLLWLLEAGLEPVVMPSSYQLWQQVEKKINSLP
jgi:hypothetical protein